MICININMFFIGVIFDIKVIDKLDYLLTIFQLKISREKHDNDLSACKKVILPSKN